MRDTSKQAITIQCGEGEMQRAAGERTAGGALHLLRNPRWCPEGSEMRLFQVKGEVVDRAFWWREQPVQSSNKEGMESSLYNWNIVSEAGKVGRSQITRFFVKYIKEF